jgi:hypothetical protein
MLCSRTAKGKRSDGQAVRVPDYFDLGGYERPVTTSSAQARAWFTRGLLWAYAFNHEESACFQRAIRAVNSRSFRCGAAGWSGGSGP